MLFKLHLKFYIFSLLSQIIRVGNDVTEFRRSIANVINQQKHLDTKEYNDDSSNSEDPLCPLTPIKIPSKDVTPKELPDRYFVVPSPDLKKKDNQINNENKKETNVRFYYFFQMKNFVKLKSYLCRKKFQFHRNDF